MTEQTARDTKLIQYLNEAYGKEKELETALQAHITMTTRPPYRKRLREHLAETKRHAREVERRIKRLGGEAQQIDLPGPSVVSEGVGVAVELGSRALAAAKGPLHAVRGTGEQEKMLKNAKTEYSEEHEEIATYTAIEVLASSLGDQDTAKLARAIRREEERMAGFLAKLIPGLTNAVIREEVPASERGGSSRKASRGKATSRSSGRASAASRTKSASSSRRASGSGTKKRASTGGSKRSGSATKRTASTAKRSGAATKRTGSAAKRATATTAKRAASTAKGSAKRSAPAKRRGASRPAGATA